MKFDHLLGISRVIACFSMATYAGSAVARQSNADAKPGCAAAAYQNLQIIIKPSSAYLSPIRGVSQKDVSFDPGSAVVVKGAGARCITGYKSGFFLTSTGDVYQLERRSYLAKRDRMSSPFFLPEKRSGSRDPERRLQSVVSLEPYGPGRRRVGVWTDGKKSTIELFSSDGAKDSNVITVADSAVALRDINYFPDPDTPSGTVTVLHDVDENTVEVLSGILRTRSDSVP